MIDTAEAWAFGIVAGVGAVSLLIAGNLAEFLLKCSDSLLPGPASKELRCQFFVRYRHLFFYTGLYANFLALAMLVEISGGFAKSPYLALFVALVLTAQQLSRFRTQAGSVILAGVGLTMAMLVWEQVTTEPAGVHTPESLEVVFVVLALFAGGMITFREKSRNYMLQSYDNEPTHAHVYKDGKGAWHFALYRDHHRLDPVLAGPTAGDDVSEALENLVRAMATEASWRTPSCAREVPSGTDYVVSFDYEAARAAGKAIA